MNFRTEIEISKASFELTHRDGIVMLGSCFSENIGMKLQRYRFETLINSHGIVFNPESVAVALEDIIEKRHYSADELIQHNEHFISLSHHGKFNHRDSATTISEINKNIFQHHELLKRTKVLFIAFGSAWAYRHNESKKIVANCHKIPQSSFSKLLITHEEITRRWIRLIEKLTAFNSDLQIVFTVSPVRYWRDGAIENTLSKSQLIIAIHALKDISENTHYFPAYELIMDDLRDYRFFKEDMLHPNEQAIQYVWEKFCGWCFSESTKKKLNELEPLIRFLEHKPIHTQDEKLTALKTEKEALIQKLLF